MNFVSDFFKLNFSEAFGEISSLFYFLYISKVSLSILIFFLYVFSIVSFVVETSEDLLYSYLAPINERKFHSGVLSPIRMFFQSKNLVVLILIYFTCSYFHIVKSRYSLLFHLLAFRIICWLYCFREFVAWVIIIPTSGIRPWV